MQKDKIPFLHLRGVRFDLLIVMQLLHLYPPFSDTG